MWLCPSCCGFCDFVGKKTLKDALCGLNKCVFIPDGVANTRPLNDFINVELVNGEFTGVIRRLLNGSQAVYLKKSSNMRVLKQSLVPSLLEYFFFLLNQPWEMLSESCKLLGFLSLLEFVYFWGLAAF